MSGAKIFLFGCLGGGVGYLLAYVLPFLRGLYQGDFALGSINTGKVIALLGIIPVYIVLGGVAAFIFDPKDAKFAIISGIGFEGIFKSATTKLDIKAAEEPASR